jgi:acyl-CoA synthetase (AMP-forming)/AMP-acid ligase II
MGAVLAPIHVSFKIRELTYAISNSRPKIIVTTTDLLDTISAALVETGHQAKIAILDAVNEVPAGYLRFSDLLVEEGTYPPADFAPEQPLLISYTSGTTSLPKPVLRSHGAETWSAEAYRKAWGFESGDRLLVAMSLSWVYGLCSLSQSAFAAGATVILESKFSPTRTLELIAAREVTAFAGTMSMYAMMLNKLKEYPYDTSALRKAFLGGEPRNEVVVAAMEERLNLRLCEAWAMTETFPALAIHPERDRNAPVACLGRVVPGVEIRLVDSEGKDVPEGQPGEAWVRSPGNFLEYSDEPELTATRRTPEGWIRSGDLLRRDAEGYYIFVTRQSEIIIRGGVNISPAEVESAICAHPEIADAIVVGVPDEVLGETVAALVTARTAEALDLQAVTSFVSERIAKFKVPSALFQVGSIPAGTTGKKNRAEARRIAIAMQEEAAR